MDALDAALRDVHPEHSQRILDRMAELEQVCRSHVNKVLKVLDNQKQALEEMVANAKRNGDGICDRLHQSGERHQAEAKVLRQELGQLKEAIDTASAKQREEAEASIAKMEKLAQQAADAIEQHEALDQKCQDKLERFAKLEKQTEEDLRQLKTVAFPIQQWRLILRSRASNLRTSSMPAILREAQRVAKSRSPTRGLGVKASLSRVAAAGQAVEPARGRSPAPVEAGSTFSNSAVAGALAATRQAVVDQ